MAAGARTNTPEGGEENYDEAVAAVLKTITASSLSSAVKAVFEHKPNEVYIVTCARRRKWTNPIAIARVNLEFLDHSKCC